MFINFIPQVSDFWLEKTAFLRDILKPLQYNLANTASSLSKWSFLLWPVTRISSRNTTTLSKPCKTDSISFWNFAGILAIPNGALVYRKRTLCVVILTKSCDLSFNKTCWYALDKFNLLKGVPPCNFVNNSSIWGRGYWSTSRKGFRVVLKSPQILTVPFFFLVQEQLVFPKDYNQLL